ncbi:MAG: thiamine ABC transporter substrate-binding protein [Psychrilyobacter sp.]|nr:thiamine ABC transporter substrate-binding protein [Psychrilyobacter sp.]
MKRMVLLVVMLVMGITSFSKEKILVYVPSSMTFLQEELGEDFKNKTGVEVEFIGIKGIPARLKLESRRPKADVVLGLSKVNVLEAKKNKWLKSYKPKTSDRIVSKNYIIDEEWYATPFDYGSLAININKDTVEKMPTSFEDIKKMKGKLITLDPNSFTGQEFMMWTIAIYGENWLDFWKELKPAIKTVAPGWSEGWAKFTTNEAPMMVGYATSDLYFDEKSSYKSIIPSEGGYIYTQGAAIVNKKEIKEGAKLFMDYILEDRFQLAMVEKNYMLPVTNIKLGIEYNRVPTSKKIVKVDKNDLEKVEEYKKELIRLLKK